MTLDHKSVIISVNFSKLRFLRHLKAEYIRFPMMQGPDNIWPRYNYMESEGAKNLNTEKITINVVQIKFLAMHLLIKN